MAAVLVILTWGLLVGGLLASPAPPNSERQYHNLPTPPPGSTLQLNRFSMLPYYLENPEQVNNYYAQHAEKHIKEGGPAPPPLSRLESLEPDSEVEILSGAQPQQPPIQQNPVQPNLPGFIPGQRVFIVHMPVPGYRPGTVQGYQPVYVVAAAPNGNANHNIYAPNGYQNPLVDPSGQVLISPNYAFPHLKQNPNPGYFIVAPAQVALARPYESAYQHQNPGYNQAVGVVPNPAGGPDALQTLRLSQLIGLYPTQEHVVANLQNLQNPEKDNGDPNSRSSRIMHSVETTDIKDSGEEMDNGRAPPKTKAKP